MVLLAIAALFYVINALPREAFDEVRHQEVELWFVPIIVLMHLVYLIIAVEIWRRLVYTVSGKMTEFRDAYLQMASVAVGKYIPGKIFGFVARTEQMNRIALPPRLSVLSSVVEQLSILTSGGLVAASAAFFVFPEHRLISGLAFIAILTGSFLLSRNSSGIIAWAQRKKRIVQESPKADRGWSQSWLSFNVAYAALWLINGLILCVIYFTLFDDSITAQKLAALVFANTIGFIVGFLAFFAPGGIGVREAITVAVLAPFLPLRDVLMAAVALRALMVFFDGVNCCILIIGEVIHAKKDA
jgi:uncharacterized membrane protein YbhN (UPF0104 family)